MKTSPRLTVAFVASALCFLQAHAALRCTITPQGNQAVITWPSELGKSYALSRSDRPDGSWRVVSLQAAAAEPLLVTVPIEGTAAFFRLLEAPPNPDPGRLAWIPPGTFTMGSPETEVDRWDNEGPQTVVTLTEGFWVGKYEVTQGEYLALIGSNPSWFKPPNSQANLNRPVEQVTWNDATNYCAKLTQQERAAGRIGSNLGYRLPTEAEWEYACRAGTTTRFSYGDDPGYINLTDYAWYFGNSSDQAHPVGQKLSNPWGLYDMHGNLWEWCQDYWSDNLPGGITVDPQGPATGAARVIRGGDWSDWNDSWRRCRSAGRHNNLPNFWNIHIGFRPVLAPVHP